MNYFALMLCYNNNPVCCIAETSSKKGFLCHVLLMFILEDSIGQLTKIEAGTTLLNKRANEHVPLSGSFTEVEQYLDQEKKNILYK